MARERVGSSVLPTMESIQMPIEIARVVLEGYSDVDGTQGVFPFLQRVFGFQPDSVANMHESLTFTLATHISRAGDPDEEDRGVPKATVVAAVVARYRDELMRNQGLWYKHHGLTDPAKQWRISDTDRATMEAALVHLIWVCSSATCITPRQRSQRRHQRRPAANARP